MQTLTSQLAEAIFIKTAKGHDEISQRRFGLDTRQRRVLILIDGTKTVSSLKRVIPGDGFDEIISELAGNGFISLAAAGARNTAARAAHAATHEPAQSAQSLRAASLPESAADNQPTPQQDAESIRQVKDFMTTTATTYLGLLSADVIHRIERAKGAAQLMTVVGHWHMALRESKQGSRFAGPYLEQVTVALAGKSVQAEKHAA